MNIIGFSGLHQSVSFKKKQFPGLSARENRIAQGFDSAAALVTESGIVAAAAEERFNREKATGLFPVHAIRYCLQEGHLEPKQVDYIAHGFAYEPFKEFFQKTNTAGNNIPKCIARKCRDVTWISGFRIVDGRKN